MVNRKNILRKQFGIEALSLTKLPGEVSLNYRVACIDNAFIMKETPSDSANEELIAEENYILQALANSIPGAFPRPIFRIDVQDEHDTCYRNPENGHQIRVLSYLNGDLLAKSPHSTELFASFGSLLAKMDSELLKMHLPSVKARRYHWDILNFDLVYANANLIEDAETRRLVNYFHLQFHEKVIPELPNLRYSLIHNDANDYNVLIKNNKVTGIIDFGDIVHSLLINEIAVALCYVLSNKENPLEWAATFIKAYNKILPLEAKELQLLYYLIAARACISICHSAKGKRDNPENKYLEISETQMTRLLKSWIKINPLKAEDTFLIAADILPRKIQEKEKIRKAEIERRSKFLSKAFSLSYDEPVKMESAAFQYMYDDRGNTFLDLRNNIPHVGHCHPKVVKAGQRAMAKLNTNTRYLYDEILDYSEKLLNYFPSSLNKVFYVNSGSAATDLALRLARTHTGKQQILTLEHSYHGNTKAAIDVSHYKFAGKGGEGIPENTLIAPLTGTIESRSKYLENLGDTPLAAFICEPIVSAGGQIIVEPQYMRILSDFAKKNDALIISDEVQLGFGRLGKYFWAFEYNGVVPDIVIIGKPIANGHPMAAVVCTQAIAESFDNGMEFFSSFGGNPVSCAIANAVLEVIEEEKLNVNAEETGKYLKELFVSLRDEQGSVGKHIGDIRGFGLSLGIEIVDGESKNPATKLAAEWVNKLRHANILVGTDGPYDNILKIKPPLCFNKENADYFITTLRHLI